MNTVKRDANDIEDEAFDAEKLEINEDCYNISTVIVKRKNNELGFDENFGPL